jgi:exopolysaccharide production protein ExoZ
MTQPPAHKLESLQALRAVAAIMVVFFHLHVYTVPVVLNHPDRLWAGFGMGYAGVEIFFVLSGFIMVLVHRHQFGQPRHMLPFIARRIERIYPLLWIVLIALIGLRALAGDGLPPLTETVRAFTLWPTAGTPILEPSWSLTFEMLFYLIFALFILDLRIGLVVAAIWFGLCLLSAITGYQGQGASLLLSPYNLLFLFGIVAALWFRRLDRAQARVAVLAGIVIYLVIGLGEVYGTLTLDKGLRTLVFGMAAVGIVAGLAALDMAGRIRTPRVLLILGDASYAIYLVHVMVMTVLAKALIKIGIAGYLPLTALILVIGALICGTLAHFLLERPVLQWLRSRRLQSRHNLQPGERP